MLLRFFNVKFLTS